MSSPKRPGWIRTSLALLPAVVLLGSGPAWAQTTSKLYGTLATTVERAQADMDAIPKERKRALKKLALFVRTKRASNEPARMTFICTHNSRRSHMGQLWAMVAASVYGIDGVETFSGGTEATAFNPRAIAAMKRAGFRIDPAEGKNPKVGVSIGPDGPATQCFSKKYDAPTNPTKNFAAVMTCSHADKNCPNVEGATFRVAIPYEDPKASDGTPEEAATYDARSRQIAAEMLYLFSQV